MTSGRVVLTAVLMLSGCAAELDDSGPIRRALDEAARESDVPLHLLEAVGYVQSRFADHDVTLDNGFGPMNLVEREDIDSVGEAATLLGVSRETIKNDPAANIRGAAALLRVYVHEIAPDREATIDDWRLAVARLSGIVDRDLADEHAEEVLRVMRDGARVELPSGETVQVGARDGIGESESALTRAYPTIRWVAASSSNYTVGRSGNAINKIVIHTMQGSYSGSISWFQNPAAQVSAHYCVRSSDGQITQMVNEGNTAWHAGNSSYNRTSIGIEHEGFINNAAWYTDAMYQSSARLTCAIVARYNIPVDRQHIIAHKEVPGSTHTDPGPNWNWNKYMQLVRECVDGGQSTAPPPPSGCLYGDGLYCGNNGVPGDARNLYRCTAGSVALEKACVTCEKRPTGEPDRCAATKCPLGDGIYCGGNGVGGDTSKLYRCTAGTMTVVESCAKGCYRAPAGTADRCN
jgi:hypothetical protein